MPPLPPFQPRVPQKPGLRPLRRRAQRPRPRDEAATCANCGGPHPDNNISCPVFSREARNKRAGTVAATTNTRADSRPRPRQETQHTTTQRDTDGPARSTPSNIRTEATIRLPEAYLSKGPKEEKEGVAYIGAGTYENPRPSPHSRSSATRPKPRRKPPGSRRGRHTNPVGRFAGPARRRRPLSSSSMANPLRTLYWNALGLKNKAILLRAVLSEQDIDVALISETFLAPTVRLHIPGYHNDRLDQTPVEPIPRRGLAVLVRRRLVHQVLDPPDETSFQAPGEELLIADRPHRLYSVYRPPRGGLHLEDVRKVLENANDIPTAMAGDWNAKSPA